jgi:hypothetical protein
METTDLQIASSTQHPLKTQLQSIEDFIADTDQLAPPREKTGQQTQTPASKIVKAVIDEDAKTAEQRALKELGEEVNWVGRLQRWFILLAVIGPI